MSIHISLSKTKENSEGKKVSSNTKANLLQYPINEQGGKLSGDSNLVAVEKEQLSSNL